MEIFLSPPLLVNAFIAIFLLSFTAIARLSSNWALALLTFALNNHTIPLETHLVFFLILPLYFVLITESLGISVLYTISR